MKKLLLLMIALLTLGVSGVWADVDAPTGYVSSIETGVNYLWCLNDGTHPRFIHADGTKTATNGHLTNAGIFQFEDAGDGYYYIKEVNTGNYMYTDYANSVTQRTGTTGKPWAYYDNNVLAAGAKEDADKFKWKVDASTGTTVSNGFFISSKVNANAVLAATSQGNTAVHFYQFTEAGTINYVTTDKYQFANSQFVRVANSLSDLSNNKCYNIYNYQAWWAVGSGATEVNSTANASGRGLNLAVSTTDTKQQFAFIKYIDKYYLYSVGEGKFAYKNGTKLSLADGFNNNVTSNGAVTFVSSTSSSYKSSAPVVVTVASKNFGVSTGYTPTVFGLDDASDNGNASAVCEAGSFTPTTALAKIESSFLFEPSTDLAPKYYAWLTAVNNNASYIHIDNSGNPVNPNNHNITTTGPIDSKYAWYFIGDPENGYAIKNKSTGTYLGGRTSSGGAMSMEASANCKFYPINEATATPTWNTWYDKVHNYYIDRSGGVPYAHTAGNKNNYIRLYNVKFSLSNAAAGLVVGSTTISDFTAYYLITSSASLSCAESGYTITAYDGYGTLTEALTNDDDGTISLTIQQSVDVTFKLKWNGDVIKSVERAEVVGEAPTAAATVFGTVPAYSSYGTPDVATIASNTEEVNINLSWNNGPFDISSDYASAVWYCMQIGSKWIEAGTTTNDVTATVVTNSARTDDAALWAFIGNPYDGVSMVNKSVGSGYYANSNEPGAESSFTITSTDEKFIIENDNGTLRFKNTAGYYMEFMDGVIGFSYDSNPELGVCNLKVRSYYCQQLIDDIYDWADNNHRDEYFGPSETSLTTLTNNIATYFPKMSQATYEGYTLPDDILDNIVPKYPSTGYYRIKNNATGSYIAYGQPAAPYVDKTAGLIAISSANAATDASSIIKLTGSGGTYKLSTEGLNVQSQTTGSQAFPATSSEGVDFVFTSANKNGIVSITNSASASQENANLDGSLHHATGWTVDGVVNYSASSANSKWILEDANTVTIPLNYVASAEGSFATMYLPFDVTLPSYGQTGFVVPCLVTITGSRAQLVTSMKTQIPAGTPVLLYAPGEVASTTATIATSALSDPITGDNDLEGTYFDKTSLEDNEYIFATKDGEIGFWKMKSGKKLGANKAYLVYDGDPIEVKGFTIEWGDITDGIRSIDNEQLTTGNEIYNLSGQRLSRLQKGINIVNGKKIIVK